MNRRALYGLVMAYSLIVTGALLGACTVIQIILIAGAVTVRVAKRFQAGFRGALQKRFPPVGGHVTEV